MYPDYWDGHLEYDKYFIFWSTWLKFHSTITINFILIFISWIFSFFLLSPKNGASEEATIFFFFDFLQKWGEQMSKYFF